MPPATQVLKLSAPETRGFWEIPILHEDDELLALDKPAGLLTSPDRYDPDRPNLMRLLHRDIERGAAWALQRGISYLANAHRLDFETSGVLLLARTKPALVHLANAFGSRLPEKTYIALVHGAPEADRFECDLRLAPHPFRPGRMRVERRGKVAVTQFEVLQRFSRHALLLCRPLTGRTHQIRVHLRARGHPLLADSFYGGGPLFLSALKKGYRLKPGAEERPLLNRAALHAESLTLDRPEGGERLRIEAPWPKDIRVALKYLRRFSPWTGVSMGSPSEQGYEPEGDDQSAAEEERPGDV